jgi:hypothetical protein
VDNGSKATAKMMAGLDLGDKYSHLCACSTPKAARSSRRVVDLTPVGEQTRVSDMNADEGSSYDAGSDTKLPAGIQTRGRPPFVRSSPDRSIAQIAKELGVSDETLCVAGSSRQRSIRESGKDCPPRSEKSSVSFAARIGFSSRRKTYSEKLGRPWPSLFRQGGRDPVRLFKFIDLRRRPTTRSRCCAGYSEGLKRSGYYGWKDRSPSKRDRENAALTKKIREIH